MASIAQQLTQEAVCLADAGCPREGEELLRFVEVKYPDERNTWAERRVRRRSKERRSIWRGAAERFADAATLPVYLVGAALLVRLLFEATMVASS